MRLKIKQTIVLSVQWLLSHPALPILMALLAILLSLPALKTGLFNDDYFQRIELLDTCEAHQQLNDVGLPVRQPGNLSTVMSQLFIAIGPKKNRDALLDYGALPWWTGPTYKVAMFRPLAGLTHWFDTQLFPDRIDLMHAHSLLWLALVVLLTSVLYRTLMPGATLAGLAALLFVLDDHHYFPAMWIANRNQLMALCFALLTLLLHHQWRTGHSLKHAVLSWICLLASLLSAEGGVAVYAFLFAYAVTLETTAWQKRILSLVPATSLILIWRLLYSHWGYGASGGGFYFDPAAQPFAFTKAALSRGPFLLAGQWFSVPPDLFAFIHDASRWPYTLVLAGLCLSVLVISWPLLKNDRLARFWCLSLHLAIIPVCAAVPMGRNLLFAGVAGFAFIAQLIFGWWQKAGWLPRSRIRRMCLGGLFWLWIVIHLPLALVTKLAIPHLTADLLQQMNATTQLGDPELQGDKDLIVVNAPNPASLLYVPYKQALLQQPLPRSLRILAPGYGTLQIHRPDANTLDIKALYASLLTCQLTTRLEIVHLYRYLSDFRNGQDLPIEHINLPGLSITVLSRDTAGQPVEIRCRFQTPLENTDRQWIRWDWQQEHYTAFILPQIGQTTLLKGPY